MFPGYNLTWWMMDSTVKQTLDAKRRLLNLLTVSLPLNSAKWFDPNDQLKKRKSALCFRAWPTSVIMELFLIFFFFFFCTQVDNGRKIKDFGTSFYDTWRQSILEQTLFHWRSWLKWLTSSHSAVFQNGTQDKHRTIVWL